MKEQLYLKYKEIIVTKMGYMLILMIPAKRENKLASSYWEGISLYLSEYPILKKLSLTILWGWYHQ
ncbi:hypothetical protein [Peribacillus frigoritolerans]|uniref:hypothetical protein n=1 Tax=Peribacillus frigoritolerans TaxID=450367 RepID=UPI0032E37016